MINFKKGEKELRAKKHECKMNEMRGWKYLINLKNM